jgi:hypothetical protein
MRRIAVLSTCVLAAGLLGSSSALATDDVDRKDRDHRWIAVEDHFAAVLPDGQTFTGDEEPPGGEEEAPPVGTQLFISEVLYDTDDGKTKGDEVGRTHIECTAQVVPVNFLCDIVFALDNGSQLHGTVLVDFAEEDTAEPLQFDIAVTGGTDDFFGATGEVSLLDITPPDDEEAATETLYEADIDTAGK